MKTPSISRRQLLRAALGLPSVALAAPLACAASAAAMGDRRFVLVILRGGLDGLYAVPAVGDPDFEPARGAFASTQNKEAAPRALDGFFALHSLLPNLHAMYLQKELLVVHAVATPYREHSHFDAQNMLETGAASPFALRTGWLNRAMQTLAPGTADNAVALGPTLPVVLQGPARVSSHTPQYPRQVNDDLLIRLKRIYAPHQALYATLQRAEMGRDLTQRAGNASASVSVHPLVASAQAAARLLALDQGPRVAVLEADGYDSHATQGSMMGIPARELRHLDTALQGLRIGLGAAWSSTVVAVVTEFGRTIAPNGSGGTDHGNGGAMFLLGGAVAGGRVIADWPGLKRSNLQDGRDLKATTDVHAVIHSALAVHWRTDTVALARAMTPHRALKAVDGIIRT
jgi:uncharacterized protein (DUF1501 family)